MNKQELHARYGPKLVGPLPGPKARAAVEADHRLISPSYTRSYPLVAKRGRGARTTALAVLGVVFWAAIFTFRKVRSFA